MKKVIIILSALSLVLAIPFTVGANPKKDYLECSSKVSKAIEDDDIDKAEDKLSDYMENYGESDASLLLDTKIKLANEDYEDAFVSLEQIKDKSSYNYYLLKMTALTQAGEDYRSELGDFCASSARANPDESDYQFTAGMSLMAVGDYDRSLYFFDRAADLTVYDGTADYFCGVLAYEMGDKDASLNYFINAKKKGVSEEIDNSIMKYADKEAGDEE